VPTSSDTPAPCIRKSRTDSDFFAADDFRITGNNFVNLSKIFTPGFCFESHVDEFRSTLPCIGAFMAMWVTSRAVTRMRAVLRYGVTMRPRVSQGVAVAGKFGGDIVWTWWLLVKYGLAGGALLAGSVSNVPALMLAPHNGCMRGGMAEHGVGSGSGSVAVTIAPQAPVLHGRLSIAQREEASRCTWKARLRAYHQHG